MTWKSLATIILKYRLSVLAILAFLSCFMAFNAGQVKITTDAGKVLPVTDSAYIRYMQFKKTFGQDVTSVVLGFKTDDVFAPATFNDWRKLGDTIQKIKGITSVISIAHLYDLQKDTAKHRFITVPVVGNQQLSAADIDSIRNKIIQLPFYRGQLLSEDRHATLMVVTFDNNVVNTPARKPIIREIIRLGKQFETAHATPVHFSGLPLIRDFVSDLVSHEFALFLGLSLGITAVILLIFFRSVYSVIFPILVVALSVVWSLGILVLLGYQITLLTGIVPPLVVIIGIPNSIFILNAYYHDLKPGGDKIATLTGVFIKAGKTTFIANVTTAIGFIVLCFTNSQLLTQFGLVASLSIMSTFGLSLILIPITFSYLPAPKTRDKQDRMAMQNLLSKVDTLVHHQKKGIYIVTAILVIISLFGIAQINVNGYVVDDLPKSSNVLEDLRFFEKSFKGVLPLEVTVDSKRKNGIMNLSAMRKIERLDKLISSYPEFSHSLSLVQGLKFTTQAFYGGDSTYFRLPDEMEQNFILNYAGNSGGKKSMLLNYIDSTNRITRLSFRMVDAGSKKMNILFAELQPRIDSIFNPAKYHVELTGSSVIFVKGTNYLVKNLYESLAWAIVLIAFVMWILFRGAKMIAISLVPNLIPLLITAGIMGFCGIPLKPSTILIFSIAMGISSDQTIYFITRYREELNKGKNIATIVSDTIRETGKSMIYIAMILFFGFGIFIGSTFGGTVALGVLLSITLLVSMVSNLTLLPAFLLSAQNKW